MTPPEIRSWLIDMDGVLVREEHAIPGADRLPGAPAGAGHAVPGADQQLDLHAARPARRGCGPAASTSPRTTIWTSALATARFLRQQRPGGTAFVIGEAGLTTALHDVGYTLTERDPDYVVLGETRTYSFERITKRDPARSPPGPASSPPTLIPPARPPDGPLPATGAVAALISRRPASSPTSSASRTR